MTKFPVQYSLVATAWLLLSAAPLVYAAELKSDAIYNKAKVLKVDIAIADADWKTLRAQTRDPGGVFSGKIEDPFSYFRGDITIDGVTIQAVGIRKKGFIGSLDDHYPSLKIKFDQYVDQKPIADLDGLTLNNNKQDSSLCSQTLAYELFNAAGVVAPRCTFAKVTVNGEDLGIYSNVESIAKPMLQRRFNNSDGNLYEGTLADFYPKAIDRIEVKANKKNHDRSQLDRLAVLLSDVPKLNIDQIETLVDVDNFLRYWAIESLIGFWDGYTNNQNNYWLYQNKANGKLAFMPWGADAAFMQGGFPGFGPQGPLSVYAESLLPNRLIQDAGISQRYLQTQRWILANVWKEDELIARIDEIDRLLDGQLHARQAGSARSMQAVKQFIKRRRKMIEQELDAWPVKVPPFPRKPMYVVPVGSLAGKFQSTRSNSPATKISSLNNIELKLTVDDKLQSFESIGISIHPAPRGGFPGFGPPMPAGPPRVDLVIEGVRQDDKKLSRFSLSLDEAVMNASQGKKIAIEGFYVPDSGAGGFGFPVGGSSVSGSITFDTLGSKLGEPIEGTLELRLSQVRGGFMDRGRVEPGKK